jgi:hypothetical protein
MIQVIYAYLKTRSNYLIFSWKDFDAFCILQLTAVSCEEDKKPTFD